jgi:cytoskeletal protein CcmA (bactofilin family)
VPEAEVIAEHDLNSLNEMDNQETEEAAEDLPQDELKAADALDEADMTEGNQDAESLEGASSEDSNYYGNPFEQMGEQNAELPEMDLLKDIEDVLSRIEAGESEAAVPETAENEADDDSKENEENIENKDDYAAGELPEADQFREDVMAEVEMNAHEETAAKIDDILEVDTTYITKNTVIRGNIKTDGSVDVLGTVKGTVSCGGKLIIGGFIKGDVDAGDVYANAAKVDGKIVAEGSVKIGVGSVVMGDVVSTSAVISGAVNGDIDVHGPVIVDSTAVVMGNIKSRSVQINNGAVIEGFCSQCYSEIDVKSFFDMEIEDDDDDDEEDQKKNEKIEPDKADESETETKSEKEPEEKSEKDEPKQDNKQSGKNGRKNNRNKNVNKNKNNNGNNKADKEDSTDESNENATENAVTESEPNPETAEKTEEKTEAEETATEDKEAGNE